MKRLLAAALVAAVPFGAAPVTHAATHPGAIALIPAYLGTMTMPVGTSMVVGSVGMISTGNVTTVAFNVAGLQPFGVYVARLNRGSCLGYTFGPTLAILPADRMGESRAVITVAATSIPVGQLAVTIGAQSMRAGAALSCGNVMTPRVVTTIQPVNSTARAIAMIMEPAPVPGIVTRTGTQVLVYATGLQSAAAQPLHIHAGPCSVPNAPIRYPLNDLVSDARGRALSGTAVTDLVPTARFSIHIHNVNWAMIACGNTGGM